MRNRALIASGVIIAVLVIDQIIKIWVKTHLQLGEGFDVAGDWFKIHFVENNGMAFGMELAGNWGKIFLSLFRIVAVVAIGWYLVRLCRHKADVLFIVCIALVWAGAVGNIVDSVFYGVIFDSSWGQVATLFPPDGGYSTWLHGRVVDMLYFPLISGHYPDWFPVVGGQSFIFFRPVFNFADASISVGIIMLLLFRRNRLSDDLGSVKASSSEE